MDRNNDFGNIEARLREAADEEKRRSHGDFSKRLSRIEGRLERRSRTRTARGGYAGGTELSAGGGTAVRRTAAVLAAAAALVVAVALILVLSLSFGINGKDGSVTTPNSAGENYVRVTEGEFAAELEKAGISHIDFSGFEAEYGLAYDSLYSDEGTHGNPDGPDGESGTGGQGGVSQPAGDPDEPDKQPPAGADDEAGKDEILVAGRAILRGSGMYAEVKLFAEGDAEPPELADARAYAMAGMVIEYAVAESDAAYDYAYDAVTESDGTVYVIKYMSESDNVIEFFDKLFG